MVPHAVVLDHVTKVSALLVALLALRKGLRELQAERERRVAEGPGQPPREAE